MVVFVNVIKPQGLEPLQFPTKFRSPSIEDAYENNCDNFVLVSGDSDLVSPVTLIRTRFPDKKVIVYVPARADQRGAAVELRTAAHANKSLPLEMIRKMQFPGRVPSGSGSFIVKPNAW